MCRSTTNNAPAPGLDLLFGDLQPTATTTTEHTNIMAKQPSTATTTEKDHHSSSSTSHDDLPPPPAYDTAQHDARFTNVDSAGVILATRYKTKMCLSIEQGEECVYQNRCMFAHSEEELRTKEQNLADGITTETAIREHRRRVHMQIKQRNKRKEKRREKQIKKQQLREQEAQGATESAPNDHQPPAGPTNSASSLPQAPSIFQQQANPPHPSAGHPIHTNSASRNQQQYRQPQPHFFLDGSYDYSARPGGNAGGYPAGSSSAPAYPIPFGAFPPTNHYHYQQYPSSSAAFNPAASGRGGAGMMVQRGIVGDSNQNDTTMILTQPQFDHHYHAPEHLAPAKLAMSPVPSSDSASGGETDSHKSNEKISCASPPSPPAAHHHQPQQEAIIIPEQQLGQGEEQPLVVDPTVVAAQQQAASSTTSDGSPVSVSDSAVVVAFRSAEIKKTVMVKQPSEETTPTILSSPTIGAPAVAADVSVNSTTTNASNASSATSTSSRGWVHNPYPTVVYKVNQGTEAHTRFIGVKPQAPHRQSQEMSSSSSCSEFDS